MRCGAATSSTGTSSASRWDCVKMTPFRRSARRATRICSLPPFAARLRCRWLHSRPMPTIIWTIIIGPSVRSTSVTRATSSFSLSPRPPIASSKARLSRVHRDAALRDAVSRDSVSLRLEARHTFELEWRALATVRLTAAVDLDQEALRFSPFQTGRGIVPSGFVHALRRATYPASQAARPSHR